jgi:PhzF family phenazine biosynthesis protein
MNRLYFVIDAFATEPFTGNPAAVLLDGSGLSDEEMQQVAAEFNLSETTFILPPAGTYEGVNSAVRFRWFSPTTEVAMCGHATVAGLKAMLEAGRIDFGGAYAITVAIETQSGKLTGFVERVPGNDSFQMIWLELIWPTLKPYEFDKERLAYALRLEKGLFDKQIPAVRTQDDDLIVFVRDHGVLAEVRPEFPELAEVLDQGDLRGLCLSTVHTITPSVHAQSRFFVPSVGINEDPVTGSVHGPLAVHLAEQIELPKEGSVSALTCLQGIPGGRMGMLHGLVGEEENGRRWVRIGGRAMTVMRGEIVI